MGALTMMDPVELTYEKGHDKLVGMMSSNYNREVRIVQDTDDLQDLLANTSFMSYCSLPRMVAVITEFNESDIVSRLQQSSVRVYVSPRWLKYHFAVVGEDLLLQKKHEKATPLSDKGWVFLEGDVFDASDYECYFFNMIKSLATPPQIVIKQ